MDHCKELVSLNNDNLATKIINYENIQNIWCESFIELLNLFVADDQKVLSKWNEYKGHGRSPPSKKSARQGN